ncbi:TPA: restriction endonuclease subunit S [Vibrio cholerae]
MSWPMVKIKDVAKVVTGKTPSTSEPANFGGHIPFITPAELGEDKYLGVPKVTLSEQGAAKLKLVPEKSVLVCCIGSLGKIGIAQQTVATNQQINTVCFDTNLVIPEYGYYALARLRPKLIAMAPATTVAIVSKSKFEELEIPLPSLAEQKRIAAILDKADAIRRKRQQAIQLADEFLRAVFLEMFGDPVTNPKGWEVKTLSELVDKLGDGLHGTPVYEQTGGYYFINGNNLRNGRIQINENVKKVSETEYVKHKKELNINTMFVSINGTIGNVAFYRNEPVVLGKSVCYFNIADGVIDKEYLFYLMSSEYFIRYATSKATGSTIKNVSLKTMREFPVPIPDKSAQQWFVKYIEIVKSLNCMEDESVSYSDSLFNSLSQKAFSGQL